MPINDAALAQDQLAAYISAHIPLAAAMQLQVVGLDADAALHLQAPLPPNRNDKGSAFGGSISSLLTLAGWGWLWLANGRANLQRDIMIYRAEFHYQQPLHDSLQAMCPAPAAAVWDTYRQTLEKRGRARLKLEPVLITADRTVAATMQAEYVAL